MKTTQAIILEENSKEASGRIKKESMIEDSRKVYIEKWIYDI